MDSRTLLMIFDAVYLLGTTAWLGAILFFSFGVAPIIFTVLEPSQAARFVRRLFPRYYAWGATAAAIALASFTSGALIWPAHRGPWALAQILLLLGVVLINLYCGNALTPRINRARDAGPGQSERFDRLHRLSVRLNSVMLLAGVVLIGIHASRDEPEGLGVTEPSPAQRALRSAERWQERTDDWRRRNPPTETPRTNDVD